MVSLEKTRNVLYTNFTYRYITDDVLSEKFNVCRVFGIHIPK